MITKKFAITAKHSGKRIDSLCAEKFPDVSRSQWTSRGEFFCKDVAKTSGTKVRTGESWTVQYEEKESLDMLHPWDFPLKILAESVSWVVIEKPEGISVHPSPTDISQKTIVNALVFQFGKKLAENFEEIEGVQMPRPGLVHRLDKTTSGALLVAKTKKAHAFFQKNWNSVEKIYYAVVSGFPPLKGKIESGIFRDVNDRQRMIVSLDEKARDATTFFEVLESAKGLSLLKVRIPTGRTHQIRVHLSSIACPILGDVKYGGMPANRVYLHAHEIKFPDPDKKNVMTSVTSTMPKGFWK